MDDSVIMSDEIIGAKSNDKETVTTNFNEKKATCIKQNFYILLALLLITVAFFIAVSIYRYLIKYQAKKKKQKSFITILRHKVETSLYQ